MATKKKTVTVQVGRNEAVQITKAPANPFGSSSLRKLNDDHNRLKIPEGEWILRRKKMPIVEIDGKLLREDNPPETIKISDMHTMQLVNAIKWCIRSATRDIMSPFNNFNLSKAKILAPYPWWKALLTEAKARKLKMVTFNSCWDPAHEHVYAEWFREAWAEIVFHELAPREKCNKGDLEPF